MSFDYALPSGWKWSSLEKVVLSEKNAIADGPFGSNLKSSDYVESGVPVLQGKNITNNIFQWKDVRYISEAKAEELKRSQVKVGDLLMIKIGSIGYCALIDSLHGFDCAVIPANMAKLSIDETVIYPKFLWFWLTSIDAVRGLQGMASKTAQPAISLAKIKPFPVPLPPLETQKQIAAVLEKADQLRKDCQKMEQELNSLAQSVFIEMFGDPLINPKSWPVNRLGELTSKITDGKHGDCVDQPNSGYFFVSAKNIRNGKIDYEGARQINKKEFDEVHKRTDLMPGDIVMINTGATIGRLAIADSDERTQRATFQKSVAVIKPIVRRLNPVFLKYVLMLRVTDFAALGSGSAIKNLLLSQIREFSIITPPLEKQNHFALKEERISTLIKIINENQDEAENSFNSLMQKAFNGELNLDNA